jgi:hypothetical protein
VSRRALASALAAAYFVVAAIGVYLPASADDVAHGRVWLLLTSGLEAADPWPLVQVAVAAAIAVLMIVRTDAWTWWRAALAGHIGSALIAYALIAAAGAHEAAQTADYGVSCVLGASFGAALAIPGLRLVGLAGTLALAPLSFGWLGIEHPLSIALGFAVTAWRRA